jgi:hypothetical protein
MKGLLIIFLLAVYVVCVLAQVGHHYVHILPVLAMGIYIYGLFTAKSAGVSNDIDSSASSPVVTSSDSPVSAPATDFERILPSTYKQE